MISHYPCKFYDDRLKGWKRHTFTAMTRQGPVEEAIYMNYDIKTTPLHTHEYLGKNKTDRQRIKKKVKRHVEKFKSLPFHERNAILEKLNQIPRI